MHTVKALCRAGSDVTPAHTRDTLRCELQFDDFAGTAPQGAVTVIHLARNRGKAEAVRAGLQAATLTDTSIVGYFDADFATPVSELERLLAMITKDPQLDAVLASRVALLGHSIQRKATRHYLGRFYATAASLALGVAVYDTQCGAKLFRNTPEFAGLLNQPFLSRWIFDVELIARLVRARREGSGLPVRRVIYEHPLMEWTDVKGSKIKLRDFIRVGVDLVRIWWRYMR